MWEYSEDFSSLDLQPLMGLPEVGVITASEYLFTFFGIRLPSLSRLDIKEIVEREGLGKNPSSVDMLRLFGRRAIACPAFELIHVGEQS